MHLQELLKKAASEAIQALYGANIDSENITVNYTRPDFEGELTVVVFPLLKTSRKSPEQTGNDIGNYLVEHLDEVTGFNVVKGFLNISLHDSVWIKQVLTSALTDDYGTFPDNGEVVVVEYCGPNTNKPLHLGHIRNICLGWSTINILKANGFKVHKANIYNDRGIAIAKSMVAWETLANGATPESTGKKSDHFVGEFYVQFAKICDEQSEPFIADGMDKEEAAKQTDIFKLAQESLRKWEDGDEETLALWRKMNNWVYQGFEATYTKMGVDFDKAYYESDTYMLGKDTVEEGIEKGVFFRKEDGSAWVDLTEEGLDQKILLRKDGTSVYLTQDLGTAEERFKDFGMNRSIYVVGNEQDYHFKVLKHTLQKMGKSFADGIYHLSYGMVDLPTGRMKTREGTKVDADDLIEDLSSTAKARTMELGKIENYSGDEAEKLYHQIAMGALKYFILRVDPKKRILFNPDESIEFNGDTGPFVQYSYARIQSVLRKVGSGEPELETNYGLHDIEKEILIQLYQYPEVVKHAGDQLDASSIAQYSFTLAKLFSKFYAELSVAKAESDAARNFRVNLSMAVASVLKKAFNLLGIEMPERM